MRTINKDERGVSEVIGVMLMVAITVLLAASVGVILVSFSDELQEPRPQVAFTSDIVYEDGQKCLEIHPSVKDDTDFSDMYVVTPEDNRAEWGFYEQGRSAVICPVEDGEVYTVVYDNGQTSYVMQEFEV